MSVRDVSGPTCRSCNARVGLTTDDIVEELQRTIEVAGQYEGERRASVLTVRVQQLAAQMTEQLCQRCVLATRGIV